MQQKIIENLNIVDIKPVIIEYPKTSHKLCKAIRQAEKDSQVSGASKNSDNPLYSETKKSENVLDEKNSKITKRSHIHKGYARTYMTEILNSFNSELQLNGTESAIKN